MSKPRSGCTRYPTRADSRAVYRPIPHRYHLKNQRPTYQATMTEIEPPREFEVTIGPGIKGTVAVPHAIGCEDAFARGYAPATTKIALILHGQGGHRNYCYQKMLAHTMARDLGMYTLRIDFRGCGESADCADLTRGRVIQQDVEDIDACAEWIANNDVAQFTFSLIISHSRGAVAMFLWALKQHDTGGTVVPNLVNCLLRFRSWTVIDRYPILDPEFDSIPQLCLRYGKIQDVPIMRQELLELAKPDMRRVAELPLLWSVLCVYGLEDSIIPIEDLAHYANHLNRGAHSSRLEVVPRADHNFYGTKPIENEDDAEEFNPQGWPLNRRKLVNYNYDVVERIMSWLQPERELERFMAALETVGVLPRWKKVDGVANFRDVGGWNTAEGHVVANLIYRCALMTNISDAGVAALKHFGVAAVFDLRSHGEAQNDGVHEKLAAAGITRYHTPVFSEDDYSPQTIAMRYLKLMSLWSTYVHVYENVLEHGWQAYKTILEYIRDDGRPFVFHCTAGKDRTGVLSMLLLLLAQVDPHTIAMEYELTTIGLKPDHPQIKAKFVETIDKLRAKMGLAGDELEASLAQGRKEWTLENDGFNNLISSRHEAMLATLTLFQQKYGGVVPYLRDHLGFSEADITKIYNRLVVKGDGFATNVDLKWTRAKI